MALTAPLLSRKRVIKVKLETEKGTKVAGDTAALVFDLEINPTAAFERRAGGGLYLGNTTVGVLGALSGECKFKTELKGNGAGALDPALAIMLQATIFKKTSEVYNSHSAIADQKTISIDVWEDGKKKGLAGASGTVVFTGEVGKRLMCEFDFKGVWQAPVDEALPTHTPGTGAPLMLRGGTFTLGTEAMKISKISIDAAAQVVERLDANAVSGIAHYIVTDYDPAVSVDPEAEKVAGYDFYGLWLAGTEAAISLVVSGDGTSVTFALPKVQYKDIKEGDRNGIMTYEVNGQINHSSGNDAITLTAAAAA